MPRSNDSRFTPTRSPLASFDSGLSNPEIVIVASLTHFLLRALSVETASKQLKCLWHKVTVGDSAG